MNLAYALAISALAGCGIYLMLSRHVFRTVLGISLLSTAVNLVIFHAGGLASDQPPLIPEGGTTLSPAAANPLPQALVLTAIVIGFALVALSAALALGAWRSLGTLDSRRMKAAESLGDPFTRERRKDG